MAVRDVFICHASADKEAVARPLADALGRRWVSCWVDEGVLRLGDSLMRGINMGLAQADVVALLITPNSMGRAWPEREMAAALSLDIAGKIRLVPVLGVSRQELQETYPLLLDTVGADLSHGIAVVADEISSLFGRGPAQDWVYLHEKSYVGPIWTRIVPRQEGGIVDQSLCIRWGDWIYRWSTSLEGPVSLTHFKERADEHRMFVEVNPPAIVTIGQGLPPDKNAVDINEGWTRPVGFAGTAEARYAARDLIDESLRRVEWIERLRAEYVSTHDDAPVAIKRGIDLPPSAWLRRRSVELGISDLLGFD